MAALLAGVLFSVPARTHSNAGIQRGASISGRVVSAATGRPVAGATLTANVADALLGGRTNDDGTFSLTVGEPGRYHLSATAPGYLRLEHGWNPDVDDETLVVVADGQRVTGIEMRLHRGGTIAGTVVDDRGEPAIGATVQAFSLRATNGMTRFVGGFFGGTATTDDRGAYRIVTLAPGEYVVAAVDRGFMTFAPSTASLEAAARVRLALDATREGVAIRLPGARGSITGRLEGIPVGLLGRGGIVLVADGNHVLSQPPPLAPQPDGSFAIPDVPAGRYHLLLRPGFGGQPPRVFAHTPVVVAPGSAARVTLRAGPGVSVSGTVQSVGLRDLSMQLIPFGVDRPAATNATLRVSPNGSWTIDAVPPGRYHVQARISEQVGVLSSFKERRVLDPGVHRLLATIRVNGEDVTDRAIEVGDKPIRGIRVEVAETAARITGRVLDAAGQPSTSGAVIVAPPDAADWNSLTRRIRMVRADTLGVYHVPHLPPGRYKVAHVTRVQPGQLWDPAFLKGLSWTPAISAEPLDVVTVDLRIR
jgi:hypothetical protein